MYTLHGAVCVPCRWCDVYTTRCCLCAVQVVWRRSLDGEGGVDEVVPPCKVSTEPSDGGLVVSEVLLEPTEEEARRLCSVTCEFLAQGDFENRWGRLTVDSGTWGTGGADLKWIVGLGEQVGPAYSG